MQSKCNLTFSCLCSRRLPLGVSYWSVPCFRQTSGDEVKKWTRNKHAIMFQLSNKTVQAGSLCFFGTDFAVLFDSSRKGDFLWQDWSCPLFQVAHCDLRWQEGPGRVFDNHWPDFGSLFCIYETRIRRHWCKLLAARRSKSRSEKTWIEWSHCVHLLQQMDNKSSFCKVCLLLSNAFLLLKGADLSSYELFRCAKCRACQETTLHEGGTWESFTWLCGVRPVFEISTFFPLNDLLLFCPCCWKCGQDILVNLLGSRLPAGLPSVFATASA